MEIERKFLIRDESFKLKAVRKERIKQGFLSSVPERAVRVRVLGAEGFLTVKGIGNQSGTTRFEWEKQIEAGEAEQLLELCEPGIIDKTRYYVPHGSHTFEVDEFFGENKGLILAEIELGSEEDFFEKPKWLGEEVTGQVKYYNAYLSRHPFRTW